jgi:hypothetical protein
MPTCLESNQIVSVMSQFTSGNGGTNFLRTPQQLTIAARRWPDLIPAKQLLGSRRNTPLEPRISYAFIAR